MKVIDGTDTQAHEKPRRGTGAGESLDHGCRNSRGRLCGLSLTMASPVIEIETACQAAASETPPQPVRVFSLGSRPDVATRIAESGAAWGRAIIYIRNRLTRCSAVRSVVVVVCHLGKDLFNHLRHGSLLPSITSSVRATHFRPRLNNYSTRPSLSCSSNVGAARRIAPHASGTPQKDFVRFHLTRYFQSQTRAESDADPQKPREFFVGKIFGWQR